MGQASVLFFRVSVPNMGVSEVVIGSWLASELVRAPFTQATS